MPGLETRITEAIALNTAVLEIIRRDASMIIATKRNLAVILDQQKTYLLSAIDWTKDKPNPNQLKLFPDEK